MKVVVFGGSGLIGKKVVDLLIAQGHEAVAASPSNGVNAITGEGLEAALSGADIIIDTMNPKSLEDKPAREFFENSTKNIISAAEKEQIKHYVILSIVGTEKLQISGYFQGKLGQETMIRNSRIPHTIVRATQFYEFASFIGDLSTRENEIRLPSAKMQPISGDDVAETLVRVALSAPYFDKVDLAGPEKIPMSEFVRKALVAKADPRKVVVDEKALYVQIFPVDDSTLTPGDSKGLLGKVEYDVWLNRQ